MRMDVAGRSYNEDEVREILRRAVERDAQGAGYLGRDGLVAAAEEMGIAPEAVAAAIDEHEQHQAIEQELGRLERERQHSLRSSVGTWVVLGAGLGAIDFATGQGWWVQYPLIVWAMLLLLWHRRALFPQPDKDRVKAKSRLERRQKDEARQAAVQRRREAGWQLEQAIERGVGALLGEAAVRLGDKAQRVRVGADAAPRENITDSTEAYGAESNGGRSARSQRRT